MEPVFGGVSPAVRRLYWYNLLISFTLTIVSNFTFIDRLLLRMEIDLSRFGTMKSVMFLLPAVLYQVLAPVIQRLNRDVEICAVCYTLRGLFPLLFPLLAVFTADQALLTAAGVVLLSGGMLCAVFANNSLMKVYRQVIPVKEFNYATGMMNMLLSLPALIFALPVAWVLDRFDHWEDQAFYLLFAGLQFLTFTFDIPAVMLLRKIRPQADAGSRAPGKRRGSLLLPYRDRKFRLILLLAFLHRIGSGFGMAYITVCFLQVWEMSMTMLVTIGLVLSSCMYAALPFFGRIMDKWGYGRVFPLLTGAMLTGLVLFCVGWNSWLVLPFFILLMWDGMASICGGVLYQGEYAAAGKLAHKAWLNAGIAAFSLCSNGGVFLGLACASGLYAAAARFSDGTLDMTLRLYYWGMIPVFAVVFCISLLFRAKKIM